MIEALHKGKEFKKTIENLSSQLQTETEEVESHPKNTKTQIVPEQVQIQQEPTANPYLTP